MSVWVIVLAGGDGRRLEEVAARHHGRPRAKQFCDFGSGRTLLQRTLDRALRLAPSERVLVITSRAHRGEVEQTAASLPAVRWIEQPANRGTTPAIALPVVSIIKEDHHVADDDAFVARVDEALESLVDDPEPTLVLGAEPEGPVDGYGWMVPMFCFGERWPRVFDFCEKPPVARVDVLLRGGACVNTFVLVAEAWTLAALVRRHAPRWFRALVAGHADAGRLDAAYAVLPASGFSEDVLSHAVDDLRLVPLGPVGWSDIGTPERLERAAWSRCVDAAHAK